MLKVVVFDSGFGGELFADLLERELPILEVIRVIDWRNAEEILRSARKARKAAEAAIRPYIGRVDLIILANYLVSVTSLKYLRRRYPEQKFLGFSLPKIGKSLEEEKGGIFSKKSPVLILATKALMWTKAFYNFRLKIKRKVIVLCLDEWVSLIDDGELTREKIKLALIEKMKGKEGAREIVLCSGQFNDIKPELYKIFGRRTRIYEDFETTVRRVCGILGLRGAKKKS